MYTILWTQGANDKWDRLESHNDVLALLKKLKADPDVCENDIWIFGPKADNHAWNGYDEFINDRTKNR